MRRNKHKRYWNIPDNISCNLQSDGQILKKFLIRIFLTKRWPVQFLVSLNACYCRNNVDLQWANKQMSASKWVRPSVPMPSVSYVISRISLHTRQIISVVSAWLSCKQHTDLQRPNKKEICVIILRFMTCCNSNQHFDTGSLDYTYPGKAHANFGFLRFFSFRVKSPYGTDKQTDGRTRLVMQHIWTDAQ